MTGVCVVGVEQDVLVDCLSFFSSCNKWSEFIFRLGPVVKGLRIHIKDTTQLQCPRSAFVREGEEKGRPALVPRE